MLLFFKKEDLFFPAWLAYFCAFLIGLALAASIFPFAALNGTLTLTHPVTGDAAQHIAGQRYFMAGPWTWPPFVDRAVEPPNGVNLALTDAIPLVALFGRLGFAWLPHGAHFIFAWVALCFVLQPMAAVFALRSAGVRGGLAGLSGAVIAVSTPSFIYRFGHAALCGHFLILLAIGISLRLADDAARGRWFVLAGLLMVASLLVHPYLMAMVVGVICVAPVSLLARGAFGAAARAAVRLFPGLAVLVLCMAAGGYLGVSGGEGFGYYSLNLFSPFDLAGSAILTGYPFVDATGGQYEGYSYLGLGVMALLLVALSQAWRAEMRAGLRRQLGLVLAAVAALVFAVSDRVYFGPYAIAHVHLVPRALWQLRSSGRFVWVDLYVVEVALIAFVGRVVPGRWAAVLLVLLAGVQFADTRDLRRSVAGQVASPAPWAADPAVFRPLLAEARLLTLWPSAECRPLMVQSATFMNLLLLASERALPINTIPTARAAGDCDPSDVLRPLLRPGELRLVLPEASANVIGGLKDVRALCHALPGAVVACMDGAALAEFPSVVFAPFPVGESLSLGTPAGARLRGIGWEDATAEGAWTLGGQASLAGAVPPGSTGLRLEMTGFGLALPNRSQVVGVVANGARIATWVVAQGTDGTFQADIPAARLADGYLTIELLIENPTRPDDISHNGDRRPLGFFLRRFRLDPDLK